MLTRACFQDSEPVTDADSATTVPLRVQVEQPIAGFHEESEHVTEAIANLVLEDEDVENSIALQDQASGKTSLELAVTFAQGTGIGLSSLEVNLIGINPAGNTIANNKWSNRKYDWVRAHRAPHLPDKPWSLCTCPRGITLCASALCIAIQLVVYGTKVEDKSDLYDRRRLPGPTLLLIALGWNRLVQAAMKTNNLVNTALVNISSLLAKDGPFIIFRNSLNTEMMKSAAANLAIVSKGHRCPTPDEHDKILASAAMDINHPRGHAARLAYFMGWQWGLRPGKEKHDLLRTNIVCEQVQVGSFLRTKLIRIATADKTNSGGLKASKIDLGNQVTYCPTGGAGRCIDLMGPYCDSDRCMVKVYGLWLGRVPIGAETNVFLTIPTKGDTLRKGRMGVNTIGKLITGAFKSIGIHDITGHGMRVFFCTRGYQAEAPEKLLQEQVRHRQVLTTRRYQTTSDEQHCAASDAIVSGGTYDAALADQEPPNTLATTALTDITNITDEPAAEDSEDDLPDTPLPLSQCGVPCTTPSWCGAHQRPRHGSFCCL